LIFFFFFSDDCNEILFNATTACNRNGECQGPEECACGLSGFEGNYCNQGSYVADSDCGNEGLGPEEGAEKVMSLKITVEALDVDDVVEVTAFFTAEDQGMTYRIAQIKGEDLGVVEEITASTDCPAAVSAGGWTSQSVTQLFRTTNPGDVTFGLVMEGADAQGTIGNVQLSAMIIDRTGETRTNYGNSLRSIPCISSISFLAFFSLGRHHFIL
jgi:hypothetical protein